MFVGTPENTSYEFVASTVCKMRWVARNDFVAATPSDYYNIVVNGNFHSRVTADRFSEFINCKNELEKR